MRQLIVSLICVFLAMAAPLASAADPLPLGAAFDGVSLCEGRTTYLT